MFNKYFVSRKKHDAVLRNMDNLYADNYRLTSKLKQLTEQIEENKHDKRSIEYLKCRLAESNKNLLLYKRAGIPLAVLVGIVLGYGFG